jgi:hypothetical protein
MVMQCRRGEVLDQCGTLEYSVITFLQNTHRLHQPLAHDLGQFWRAKTKVAGQIAAADGVTRR